MTREPVNSSNIKSAGYDTAAKILEIEYANGNVYEYFDVPEEFYAEFLDAPSKGAFMNRYKGGFPYQKKPEEKENASTQGGGSGDV